MPQSLIALLPAIIGAGTAATSIGLEASGALSPGGGGSQSQLLEQQNLAQQKELKQQEEQAFRRFAPDVQAQTGGSLSDASFAQTVAELAGQPGDLGLAQQTIFGNTSNPGSGLPTTESGLSSGGIG